MKDEPSNRVVDQRVRNRIMDALETLALGDEGVRAVWPTEYFEGFYDLIPHSGEPHPNSCISFEERTALSAVSKIVDEACDATPPIMTADELIATGWPDRIRPIAQGALSLMESRGRFSEELEVWGD
jgi:hypothetical protein